MAGRANNWNRTVEPGWIAVLSDPVRLSLLRCLCEVEAASAGELAPRAHTGERTARRHLEAMVRLGLVEESRAESDGETPGRPAASYGLASGVRERAGALFELLSMPLAPARRPSPSPPRGR
jgi:predicted ArsR family transcriptional regulator